MKHPLKHALIATALCTMALNPVTAAPESRDASAAELASFQAHYRQQYPGSPPAKPVFSITRENEKSAWAVSATVDSAPQAGAGRLCRMTRSQFRYSGGQWSADQSRAYAWMERPLCKDKARAVEMLHPMPDTDLIALLPNRMALLHGARILLGGNTACASQRAFKFELAKVDVGSTGPNPEVLAGLVFRSDHGTYATVWVKRSGLDYTAWNVSCK
jgi:hypothetical protein